MWEALGAAELPMARTSLIGRGHELDSLMALVDAEPFVTITGAGGVGKTRLALEVAATVAATGRRVWFVELADVDRPGELIGAIADSIGVTTAVPGAPLDEVVARRLEEEPTLLVLDNMEQLVAAADDVAELAGAGHDLRIVVTSRTALHVRAERVFVLGGLALVSGDEPAATAPSVQLFVERIGADATSAPVADAAAICAAVDGLPLAIELAAAHARTLGPSAVRELIESEVSLTLLDRGPMPTPRRQRSLRGSLEWSYRLLDPTAQRAFRALGAFSGSFDLAAFRAVAARAPAEMSLAAFTTLVEYHLVEPIERVGTLATSTSARYTVSPPIRELARELLAADAARVDIETRHTRWFATVAARASRLAEHAGIRDAIAIYRADQPNLLAALRRQFDEDDLSGAARLACDLAKVWEELGRDDVVREWFDSLLAAAAVRGTELPPEVTMIAAYCALVHGARASADDQLVRLEAAVDRARAARDDAAVLRGLGRMTLSYTGHGRVDVSRRTADEGRALADRVGEDAAAAEFTMWTAMLAHQSGDLATAWRVGREALQRARKVGDDRLIVRSSLLLSSMPRIEGSDEEDIPSLDALLELARATENVLDELFVTSHLAMREAARGDVGRGFAHARAGLEMARRTGARHLELIFLFVIATSALRVGDDRAVARFHASVAPNTEMLRGLMAPGEVERYESCVANRRAAIGAASFDRHVGMASARSWREEIAEAERYAARKARSLSTGRLTPRERDVLSELVTGATNKQIAGTLGLTPKTVTHHCAAIYRKLDVQTRAEATAYALQHGLV
jgi:predicted ATPase/DNA-binding CsgD family transcriptional regulator